MELFLFFLDDGKKLSDTSKEGESKPRGEHPSEMTSKLMISPEMREKNEIKQFICVHACTRTRTINPIDIIVN